VPRPPRHELTSAARRALPRPMATSAARYLRLLDRRLGALARVADGDTAGRSAAGMRPADRALARRFLAPREGQWTDGDENLVRGYLDRWSSATEAAGAEARAVLEAAHALAAIDPPPGALWFFLWEMESVLAGLFGADKEDGPC